MAAAEAMNQAKPKTGGYNLAAQEPMKIDVGGGPAAVPAEPKQPAAKFSAPGPPAGGPPEFDGLGAMDPNQMMAAAAQMGMMPNAGMMDPAMQNQMNQMMMMNTMMMNQMMSNPYMQQMMMNPMMNPLLNPAAAGGMMPPGMPKAPGFSSNSGGKGKGKGNGDKAQSKAKAKKGAKAKGRPSSPPPAEADDSNANRSEKLMEVRKNAGKCKYSVEEIAPHIVEFAKDQHGSRFLQTKLDEGSDEDKKMILQPILPETKALSLDQFGNFVLQKLFDVCNIDQKKEIVQQLKGNIKELAMENHGCRVVQKALSQVAREIQTELASELKDCVPEAIENMHGNHVIQKCIEQMPPDSVSFIIGAINLKVEHWASHTYGCRIIQRLLEHCGGVQLHTMLDLLVSAAKRLAKNLYGNYVVQHMLEHGRKEDKARIMQTVCQSIGEFSSHRCSSNVVEKCFEIASIGEHAAELENERHALYRTVIGDGSVNAPLSTMVEDKFGNYIVQRMIEHSKGPDRQQLVQRLTAMEPILKNSNNGKHIIAKLQAEAASQ